MKIAVLTIAVLLLGMVTAGAQDHPKCSSGFVAAWKNWKSGEHAMEGRMPQPKKPCIMQSSSGNAGTYLCNKNGCSRVAG